MEEGRCREVLEWFSQQPTPPFAMFGRFRQGALAGAIPDKAGAYAGLVERLFGMGHRRIVNLVREDRENPSPFF